jgi:hypothetical protein
MIAAILVASLLTSTQMQNIEKHFPAQEIPIMLEVAKEYELNQDETILLFSIRRVENSGMLRINEHGKHVTGNSNGMQFGVGDGITGHSARRYAGDFSKSLHLQAQWAAGTIKKRYRGKSLESFAHRWCPVNQKNWATMVTSWKNKLE